jgi:hypothetical protein
MGASFFLCRGRDYLGWKAAPLFARFAIYSNPRTSPSASLDAPHLEKIWSSSVNAEKPFGDKGYENISLVTECRTGKLYAIASTAPEFKVGSPDTYYGNASSEWGLYRVEPGPKLEYVARNRTKMFDETCDPRATGTAFAGPNGELGLYCHQKQRDAELRKEGVKCAVAGVFSALFPPLAALLPVWCLDLLPDKDILFTEYWPHSTPERPIRDPVKISITIDRRGETGRSPNSPAYVRMIASNEFEARCGLSPTSADVLTCTWSVPRGTTVSLVPDTNPLRRWSFACSGQNITHSLGMCVVQANADINATLHVSSVI